MANRTEYMREYQRRRRAEDPERAKAENRLAYQRLKERERADPSLKERRERKQREWAQAHLEERAAHSRRSYDRIRATPEGLAKAKARQRAAMARYFGEPKNRAKIRARWVSSRALRDGRLERRPCEECGGHAEMHHDDYSQPLAVRWLCKAHHERAHRALA